jgi:YfiH family protein
VSEVTPLRSPLLARYGFRHGFSPRRGGVSRPPFDSCNVGAGVGDDPEHVAENRRRFADAVGYAPDALFEVDQVHGREVHAVCAGDDPARLRGQQGDGLVGERGASVGVRTADCVPILLADPETRCAAALHAGWRGAAAGVVPSGLELLLRVSQAPVGRLIAGIFPHIRACCFEVSEDVAEALAAAWPLGAAEREALVRRRPGAKPHVDLAALLRAQLMAAGLCVAHIDLVPGCTRCSADSFFSYRREGSVSGRHLSAIVAV